LQTNGPGLDERLTEQHASRVIARRPDAVALAAILIIAAAAWLYLLSGPAMPGSMSGMGMTGMEMAAPSLSVWGWKEWLLLFTMWAVMMVAMMLPSATPTIRLFSRMGAARTTSFAIGYLIVWWGFSAIAALIQWGLHSATLLSADMRTASPLVGGVILIAAGVYQWLPLKQACLTHCRSPLGFLMSSWKEGQRGALVMGIKHGTFCLGCCWMLMALLFVAGVMNLVWVAVLSGIVLLEKTFPAGPAIARAAGVVLVVAGVALVGRSALL